MSKIIIDDVQCPACDGTGLYIGCEENARCAVVCTECDGSGKTTYEYIKFSGKRHRIGIKKVYKSVTGYEHEAEDVVTRNGDTIIKYSEGGVSYDDWLKGKKPKPVKDLYCPFSWTKQWFDSKIKRRNSRVYKERCSTVLLPGRCVYNCPLQSEKHKCWQIHEVESK